MSQLNTGVKEENNTGVKELVDKNMNSKEEMEIFGSDKTEENVGDWTKVQHIGYQEVMNKNEDTKEEMAIH